MTPELWIVVGMLLGGWGMCLLLLDREDWRTLQVGVRWYWRALKAQRLRIRIPAGRPEDAREAAPERAVPIRSISIRRFYAKPSTTERDRRQPLNAIVRGGR